METVILLVGGLILLGFAIVVLTVIAAILTALMSVGTMPFVAVIVGVERGFTAVRRRFRSGRAS